MLAASLNIACKGCNPPTLAQLDNALENYNLSKV
jgi:hypothetical protein